MTITLHHCISARSFRPLWMLEEIGLPYELRVWPFPPRVKDKRYFEHNALGTVPAFVDGALRMTESAAICQYLAQRHSPRALDVAPDEPAFGEYLNLLHFGEATLTFPQTLVLRYRRFEPDERKQPQVADDYATWFLARLRTLEPRLAANEWLCAGRFTAADVSVGYALVLAGYLDLADRFTPAVAAYGQRVQARAAYQRALAAQDRAAIEQGVPLTPAPLA
ncbi:glutathione S-transferase family protein [Aquincola sp. S2]|uniref:Glutathione S-transferase family protein n=1 Tax=Pseudaquabacterium terrae TaxID=2732868 RepID=A0ABX2EAZ0_9BURK|nr:glutathione S-transferase family protein [Aquabacterium terrae]NRF66030.1 glutathione S-transferase family protein [Aquabacterium terrae]